MVQVFELFVVSLCLNQWTMATRLKIQRYKKYVDSYMVKNMTYDKIKKLNISVDEFSI